MKNISKCLMVLGLALSLVGCVMEEDERLLLEEEELLLLEDEGEQTQEDGGDYSTTSDEQVSPDSQCHVVC